MMVRAGLGSLCSSVSPSHITIAVGTCKGRSWLEEPGHKVSEALFEGSVHLQGGRSGHVEGKLCK